MYLSKENIFWKERQQKMRRNDLRRLFNQLQTQRKRAPQSRLRQKPLMAGGKLPQQIQCKVKNFKQEPVDVTITDELQHGAFSQGIYKAHTKKGREVALKRVDSSRNQQTAYENEKRILLQIRKWGTHPNIIQLLGYDDDNRNCWPRSSSFLVLQYANKGDLLDLDRVKDTPDMRWNYAKQIVAAIAYAHSKGLAHGDIKMENILRHDDTIWVTDWGHATTNERSTRIRGSIGYISVNMSLKVYSRKGFNESIRQGLLYDLDRWDIEQETNMQESYNPKKEDIFTLANTLWLLLVCENYILHQLENSFWPRVDKMRSLNFIKVFQQTCPEFLFTTDSDKKNRIKKCFERCFLEDETKRLNIHQVNSILFDVTNPTQNSNASRKRKKEKEASEGAKRPNIHTLKIRVPTKK